MAPRFDDLFAFDTGLCHLRVYVGASGERVALAVHLADCPGRSVSTGAEALMQRITEVFGGPCRLFSIFPSFEETWTEVLCQAGETRATFDTGVSHGEVERLAGEPVEIPPAEVCTAAGLGGAQHPLLALISPRKPPRNPLDEIGLVAAADLPWAHNPFRCAHSERFEAIRGLYPKRFDGYVPAGAHFFLSLDADRFAACRYHQHDWVTIARASVLLLEGLAPGSHGRDVYSAAAELLPDEPDRGQLICLFTHPIIWWPGGTSVADGQHRTCALKAAGAPLCVALISGGPGYKATAGDVRRRARRTLAEHWVRELDGREDAGGDAGEDGEPL